MKQSLLLCITVFIFSILAAQPLAKKITPGIHWVKITWYKPLPGSQEPDKSKVPDIYLHPNQLIEYNRDGNLMAAMDYQRGSDEQSGATLHYYWDGTLLKKEVQENDNYEAMYTVIYSYDASGNEIKNETKRGPADKFGITTNGHEEKTWAGGKLTKTVWRNEKGALQNEVTYTYNNKGQKIREDYYPAGLYAGKTFTYDNKGNMLTDSYIDKDGQSSSVWTHEYNAAGKEIKLTLTSYYKGAKQSTEITSRFYDAKGECIQQIITKEGTPSTTYSWKHTYDAKGSRIQTVHLKNGIVEYIEVRSLRYY